MHDIVTMLIVDMWIGLAALLTVLLEKILERWS